MDKTLASEAGNPRSIRGEGTDTKTFFEKECFLFYQENRRSTPGKLILTFFQKYGINQHSFKNPSHEGIVVFTQENRHERTGTDYHVPGDNRDLSKIRRGRDPGPPR